MRLRTEGFSGVEDGSREKLRVGIVDEDGDGVSSAVQAGDMVMVSPQGSHGAYCAQIVLEA